MFGDSFFISAKVICDPIEDHLQVSTKAPTPRRQHTKKSFELPKDNSLMDTIYFIRYTKTKCKSKVDQNSIKTDQCRDKAFTN